MSFVCVIMDANVASRAFGEPQDPDFRPVVDWLASPRGMLVYGGKLKVELFRVDRARRFILRLNQAGRATQFPQAAVDAEERRVRRTGACKSDDPHVIALAIVSGARTLCSKDTDLHEDFKNRELIEKGRVYQNASHGSLLTHTASCRRQQKKLASGSL